MIHPITPEILLVSINETARLDRVELDGVANEEEDAAQSPSGSSRCNR